MKLEILESHYAVCKLPFDRSAPAVVPGWASGQLVSFSVTDNECSLVVSEECLASEIELEPDFECVKGWRAFRIAGQLDFDMVGVIAKISDTLARAQIPIFVVSTYQTDYVLVASDKFKLAKQVLESTGYQFD